ncbi:hypothetical protein [Sulfuriroseicoccus oceanibius]|uniref:Uncharacterized protein n=1 Tax=Sulfuriroseicoccus oceanibius TaxID=2707525 RepID=A0A6B3L8B5_9BACT|nr:hypothetical protein [Sulfuriroseicoccus oceanibius]QQL44331.1 hypothetical protein G3M56_010600 [Sulfuriroseicoccus oceanibius]
MRLKKTYVINCGLSEIQLTNTGTNTSTSYPLDTTSGYEAAIHRFFLRFPKRHLIAPIGVVTWHPLVEPPKGAIISAMEKKSSLSEVYFFDPMGTLALKLLQSKAKETITPRQIIIAQFDQQIVSCIFFAGSIYHTTIYDYQRSPDSLLDHIVADLQARHYPPQPPNSAALLKTLTADEGIAMLKQWKAPIGREIAWFNGLSTSGHIPTSTSNGEFTVKHYGSFAEAIQTGSSSVAIDTALQKLVRS